MTPIDCFLFTRIPSTMNQAENQGFWLDTESAYDIKPTTPSVTTTNKFLITFKSGKPWRVFSESAPESRTATSDQQHLHNFSSHSVWTTKQLIFYWNSTSWYEHSCMFLKHLEHKELKHTVQTGWLCWMGLVCSARRMNIQERNRARHSSSWWCSTKPSLVTKGSAVQKISSEQKLIPPYTKYSIITSIWKVEGCSGDGGGGG